MGGRIGDQNATAVAGGVPGGNGWDVDCFSIKVRVNRFRGVGESKGCGFLGMVARRADKSMMAFDKSAIASSRRSAACIKRETDACQGVQIMERYVGWERLRVECGCVVVLCGGVVVASAPSSSMVAVGFSVVVIIIGVIVASSSSSMMGIVGVGIGCPSGLGLVVSVVSGMRLAGVVLHVRGTTWQHSASVMVVVAVGIGTMVSWLLQEG